AFGAEEDNVPARRPFHRDTWDSDDAVETGGRSERIYFCLVNRLQRVARSDWGNSDRGLLCVAAKETQFGSVVPEPRGVSVSWWVQHRGPGCICVGGAAELAGLFGAGECALGEPGCAKFGPPLQLRVVH